MNNKTTAVKDKPLSDVMNLLPRYICDSVGAAIKAYSINLDFITDLRIRRDGGCFIGTDMRAYKMNITVSGAQFDEIIFNLCGGSLYACADTIREGYINADGIRCGVCGRAVINNGVLSDIADISSLCIRVARDITGVSERVYSIFRADELRRGELIYSPPGVGKTTLLRDLIRRVSDTDMQYSVVDCRGELASACRGGSVDLLSGYSKAHGIKSAVRSLSPKLIICDELSGGDDADAALFAYSCGVPIITTVHGGSLSEVYAREEMSMLLSRGVFGHAIGITRRAGSYSYDFNITKITTSDKNNLI